MAGSGWVDLIGLGASQAVAGSAAQGPAVAGAHRAPGLTAASDWKTTWSSVDSNRPTNGASQTKITTGAPERELANDDMERRDVGDTAAGPSPLPVDSGVAQQAVGVDASTAPASNEAPAMSLAAMALGLFGDGTGLVAGPIAEGTPVVPAPPRLGPPPAESRAPVPATEPVPARLTAPGIETSTGVVSTEGDGMNLTARLAADRAVDTAGPQTDPDHSGDLPLRRPDVVPTPGVGRGESGEPAASTARIVREAQPQAAPTRDASAANVSPRETAHNDTVRALDGTAAHGIDVAEGDAASESLRPVRGGETRNPNEVPVVPREPRTESLNLSRQTASTAERSEIDVTGLRALRPEVRWMRTVGIERTGDASAETLPADADIAAGREPRGQHDDGRAARAELRQRFDAGWTSRWEQPEIARDRWTTETRLADLGRDTVVTKSSGARVEVEPARAFEPAAGTIAAATTAGRFAPVRSTVTGSTVAEATTTATVVRAATPPSGSSGGSGSGMELGAGSTPLPLEPTASLEGVSRLAQAHLAEAIVARARNLAPGGSIELRFALEPEALGMVRVHIEARGDELRVRIVAASGAAVESLSGGISRLSSQLHDAGFKDARIDLTFEDSAGRGPRERGEGGWGQDDRAPRTRPQVVPAAIIDAQRSTRQSAMTRLDRMA